MYIKLNYKINLKIKYIEINRKIKFYEISKEDESTLRKWSKAPKNYDKKMEVKDILNNRLVDSKIVNEFNRKVKSK